MITYTVELISTGNYKKTVITFSSDFNGTSVPSKSIIIHGKFIFFYILPSNNNFQSLVIMFYFLTDTEKVEQLQADNAPGNAIANQLDCELNDIDYFSWFFNRPKLNRLEIRAALSMSINMIPFWFCAFPLLVENDSCAPCRKFHLQSTRQLIKLNNMDLNLKVADILPYKFSNIPILF